MNPLSGIFGEAWELYKAHWRHFFVLAFIIYAALALLALLLVLLLDVLGVFIGAFVSLAGAFFLQGVIVKAVEDVRDGRADLSARETVERMLPRFNKIAIAGILATLGIVLGLILLIVPGLVLLTFWILLIPALVLEERGVIESFGRSRELVRGHGWQVFGTIVLTILILIGVGIVLGLVVAPLEDWLGRLVSDIVSNTVVSPFVVLTWTLVYYRLRAVKEPVAAPEPAL